MKRIALTLALCLGATIAQADDYDVVDFDIFRSVDPLAQRDEHGLLHQGKHACRDGRGINRKNNDRKRQRLGRITGFR